MADTKISELPEFTQAGLDSWAVAVDNSGAAETKKISFQNLFRSRGVYHVEDPVTVFTIEDARQNSNNIDSAIQAAAAAGGGTVRLGRGTYEVADPSSRGYCIEMESNIRLIGHTTGTTIKVSLLDTTNPLSIIENSPSGISNCEIAHMAFDGTKSRLPDTVWGFTENEGIDLDGSENLWIHHCRIHDCATDAIDLDNNVSAMVTDCYIHDNGGVAVHGGSGTIIVNNIISQNNAIYRRQSTSESVRASAACVSFIGCSFSIFANISSTNDSAVVVLIDATRCSVVACNGVQPGDGVTRAGWPVAYNGGGDGIRFEGCTQSVVTGCNIQLRNTVGENEGNCFRMESTASTTRRSIFSACCASNGRVGFSLENAEQSSVVGCASNAQGVYHIQMNNLGDGCLAEGNVMNGAPTGFRVENGTSEALLTNNIINNATSNGVDIFGPCVGILINGNKITNSGRALRFFNSGGAPSNCSVTANDFLNNTNIAQLTGTGHTIKNNKGLNPVGQSSITVGASPFTYTAGYYATSVHIYGGTVSDISKGGTTIATSSDTTVLLDPGQAVTVTYSVAPTMVADEI